MITVNTVLTFLFPAEPFFVDTLQVGSVLLMVQNPLQNTQNR